MEKEKISTFEGPPLFFFQLLPKSSQFLGNPYMILLEPLLFLIGATVLGRLFIFQPGLTHYLQIAALMLAMKQMIEWHRAMGMSAWLMDSREPRAHHRQPGRESCDAGGSCAGASCKLSPATHLAGNAPLRSRSISRRSVVVDIPQEAAVRQVNTMTITPKQKKTFWICTAALVAVYYAPEAVTAHHHRSTRRSHQAIAIRGSSVPAATGIPGPARQL